MPHTSLYKQLTPDVRIVNVPQPDYLLPLNELIKKSETISRLKYESLYGNWPVSRQFSELTINYYQKEEYPTDYKMITCCLCAFHYRENRHINTEFWCNGIARLMYIYYNWYDPMTSKQFFDPMPHKNKINALETLTKIGLSL